VRALVDPPEEARTDSLAIVLLGCRTSGSRSGPASPWARDYYRAARSEQYNYVASLPLSRPLICLAWSSSPSRVSINTHLRPTFPPFSPHFILILLSLSLSLSSPPSTPSTHPLQSNATSGPTSSPRLISRSSAPANFYDRRVPPCTPST
jgi:hypothetical protein